MKHYFVLFSLISTMAIAQNQTPTVEVVGEGIVYATPDMVNISIRFEEPPTKERRSCGSSITTFE